MQSMHHTVRAEAIVPITRWIALKTIISEHAKGGDVVTPESARHALRLTQTIPENFRVWISRCGVDGWQAAFHRHTALASSTPTPPADRGVKNIQGLALGIGDLFIYLIHTTDAGIDLDLATDASRLFKFFPAGNSAIHWPPRRPLAAFEASHIAETLNRLFQSDQVKWLP
jgi:hypothetical protein